MFGVPVWIRISTAWGQVTMLTTWAVLLCKYLGHELERSYLFVTNTGLLPGFIYVVGFISLYAFVSVHVVSSMLKSSASVYIRQDLPRGLS